MNGLIFSLAPLGGLATALPAMSAAATRSFKTASTDDPLDRFGRDPVTPREPRLDGTSAPDRDGGYLFL